MKSSAPRPALERSRCGRQIRQRRAQRRFIERALASRDEALRTGDYYTTADILRDLDGVLAHADASLTR